MKAAPPGWAAASNRHAHRRLDRRSRATKIASRPLVAEMIARAMPQPGNDTVAAIRTRMLARHMKALGYV